MDVSPVWESTSSNCYSLGPPLPVERLTSPLVYMNTQKETNDDDIRELALNNLLTRRVVRPSREHVIDQNDISLNIGRWYLSTSHVLGENNRVS